jgi:hypothetical protein
MPKSYVGNVLRVTPAVVRNNKPGNMSVRLKHFIQTKRLDDRGPSRQARAANRSRMQPELAEALETYFIGTKCSKTSGDRTGKNTTRLHSSHRELDVDLYARYTAILRTLIHHHPHLLKAAKAIFESLNTNTTLSRLQKGLLAASVQEAAPGFSEGKEFNERRDERQEKHSLALAKKEYSRLFRAGRRNKGAPREPQAPPRAVFDPRTYKIPSPGLKPLFRAMKERGHRWTRYVNDTYCTICKHGGTKVKALEAVRERIREMGEGGKHNERAHVQELTDLLADEKVLARDVGIYELHRKQFLELRADLQKYEATMPVGRGTIKRDFVNEYIKPGTKVGGHGQLKNLVMVIKYRLHPPPAPLLTTVLHNLVSDPQFRKCTAEMVAYVQDWHLQPKDDDHPGILRALAPDGIKAAGDKGPCFIGKVLKYAQSTYWDKYKYPWEDHHFCNNHAYSEADADGQCPIALGVAAAARDENAIHANDYSDLVNYSKDYTNHYAFPFGWTPSADDPFFPVPGKSMGSILGNTKEAKKVSLVKYDFTGASGRTERERGVFFTKNTVSDKWVLQSLNPRDQVDMCWVCADAAQRPVRHVGGEDPACVITVGYAKQRELLPDRQNLPRPKPPGAVPQKLDEPEALAEGASAASSARSDTRKPVGEFPCKFYPDGCRMLYYNTPGLVPNLCFEHAVRYSHRAYLHVLQAS